MIPEYSHDYFELISKNMMTTIEIHVVPSCGLAGLMMQSERWAYHQCGRCLRGSPTNNHASSQIIGRNLTPELVDADLRIHEWKNWARKPLKDTTQKFSGTLSPLSEKAAFWNFSNVLDDRTKLAKTRPELNLKIDCTAYRGNPVFCIYPKSSHSTTSNMRSLTRKDNFPINADEMYTARPKIKQKAPLTIVLPWQSINDLGESELYRTCMLSCRSNWRRCLLLSMVDWSSMNFLFTENDVEKHCSPLQSPDSSYPWWDLSLVLETVRVVDVDLTSSI
jgi:hypothetical protein